MTKKEFLHELRARLSSYPKSELDRHIGYWSEIIDDRIEDGTSEQDVIESLGSIDDIVAGIEMEMPLKELIKTAFAEQRKAETADIEGSGTKVASDGKLLLIILLILASPIIIPVVITLLALMLTFAIIPLSILLCFGGCAVGGAVCFVGSLFYIIVSIFTSGGTGVLTLFGTAFSALGIGIIFTYAAYFFGKFILAAFRTFVMSMKRTILKKRS